MQTDTFLDRIVADVRAELEASKERLPFTRLRARLREAPPPKLFIDAIRGDSLHLIAEVKKASPSAGLLRPDLDPVGLAQSYTAAGAAAPDAVAPDAAAPDAPGPDAPLQHLSAIRAALDGPSRPPLLRKDFLFDMYQLYEARLYGADAVLLIAAILNPGLLAQLIALARELSMAALVEVHDEAELERALAAGAELIGINHRDLRTFRVDLSLSERLRPLIPPEVTVVAESGLQSREDILRMQALGIHAVLVGEALVRAPDPARKIREIMG